MFKDIMKNKLLALFIICSLFISCYINEPESTTDDFAIYLLADTTITINNLPDKPLNEFILARSPLISLDDIITYEWPIHLVHVKQTAESKMTDLSKPGTLNDRPFIVIVNGERIYMGAIWPAHYSTICLYPHIVLPSLNPYHIMHGVEREDKRKDIRIYTVLKNAGKLVYPLRENQNE
jgi:hypothetical protein